MKNSIQSMLIFVVIIAIISGCGIKGSLYYDRDREQHKWKNTPD